jgi:hypothetical protein
MTRLAPILFCLLAFGLAACGDDDDAPSRQQFADRADEICADADASLESVAEGAESPDEIADAVDRVIEESEDALNRLSDLERPEGDAGETAEEFIEATRSEIRDKGIPALEDLRDAIRSGDQEAVQEAAQELQAVNTDRSEAAAKKLGANRCAGS